MVNKLLPSEIFELATSLQSPDSLPGQLPKFGFFWWIKNNQVRYDFDELGRELPDGAYQILGASGCSCTVIPSMNVVAVRMYNSLYSLNKEYDYVKDIQTFGDLVVSSLKE